MSHLLRIYRISQIIPKSIPNHYDSFQFLKITRTLKDYEGFSGYDEVLKELYYSKEERKTLAQNR